MDFKKFPNHTDLLGSLEPPTVARLNPGLGWDPWSPQSINPRHGHQNPGCETAFLAWRILKFHGRFSSLSVKMS